VWNNPLNDPKVGLAELKKKGLDWVDKLRVRPLNRRNIWLSLESQQYPKLSYGLSVMGSIYYQALPFLCI
jgi:hypothetical protein